MKQTILIITFLLVGVTATFAQFTFAPLSCDFNRVEKIKNGKVIIGLLPHSKYESEEEKADIDKINRLLESTIRQYWTFSEIQGAFPSKEAKKMIRKNPDCFIIEPFLVSSSQKAGGATYHSSNYALTVYRGGKWNRKAMIMYPYAINGVNKALLAYMVTALQHQLGLVYTNKFSTTNEAFRNTNMFKDELKQKTLLIPKDMMDGRVTQNVFAQHYPYPFELCSRKKYNDAILDKDDQYAYIVYTQVPAGSNYLDYYFFVNAADGALYASVDLSKKLRVMLVAQEGRPNQHYNINSNPKLIGFKQLKHIQQVWAKDAK